MIEVKVSNNLFIPMPMAIVGTMNDGKPNFMAAGWNTRVNANPPMLAVGIGKSHLTHDTILKNKLFSFNIPGRSLIKKTDYAGIVSGEQNDKSELFELFYGEHEGAPLIKEAVVAMECQLVEAVDLPTNTLFIAEIVGAWCDPAYMSDGMIDFKKAESYFLTMPDNKYWAMGEELGKAWSIGKEIDKEGL